MIIVYTDKGTITVTFLVVAVGNTKCNIKCNAKTEVEQINISAVLCSIPITWINQRENLLSRLSFNYLTSLQCDYCLVAIRDCTVNNITTDIRYPPLIRSNLQYSLIKIIWKVNNQFFTQANLQNRILHIGLYPSLSDWDFEPCDPCHTCHTGVCQFTGVGWVYQMYSHINLVYPESSTDT